MIAILYVLINIGGEVDLEHFLKRGEDVVHHNRVAHLVRWDSRIVVYTSVVLVIVIDLDYSDIPVDISGGGDIEKAVIEILVDLTNIGMNITDA